MKVWAVLWAVGCMGACGGNRDSSNLPCGACLLQAGDVIALNEERFPTPPMGTPEYIQMTDQCSAVVLDRIMPADPSGFSHTILITEGGSLEEAKFIHASDPGGVFEGALGDWIRAPQTACGWRFVEMEVYRPPSGYKIKPQEAVRRAQTFLGETYAIRRDFIKPETWDYFRDHPEAQLVDLLRLESFETALAVLGETTWDFGFGGESSYDRPRYCGKSKIGSEPCEAGRNCNICPPAGQGTKYCSELIWWAYGGDMGELAGGSLHAGLDGEVPDLYWTEYSGGLLAALSHTSDDLAQEFEIKCPRAMIPDLKLANAQCD